MLSSVQISNIQKNVKVVTLQELNDALLCPELCFGLTKEIFYMFSCKKDETEQTEFMKSGLDRFEAARKLYQNIWNNGKPKTQFAFFYKLSERKNITEIYSKSLLEIVREFKVWLKVQFKQSPPTIQNIISYFDSIRLGLTKIENKKLEEQIKFKIIDHLISLKTLNDLQIIDETINDEWFNKQKKEVNLLCNSHFFKVPDYKEAVRIGCIYTPGEKLHNWGVNASWVLAVTRSKIPIKVISDITLNHLERTSKKQGSDFTPSAFALEIAIAFKMGYGLNIEKETITLVPPLFLRDYETNGVPGVGPLPTKEEEGTIYRRCLYARELHKLLSSNSIENLKKQVIEFCTLPAAQKTTGNFLDNISKRLFGNKSTKDANIDSKKSEDQKPEGASDKLADKNLNKSQENKLDKDLERINFIYGLHYLQLGSSLIPILSVLEIVQIESIQKVLTTKPLDDEIFDTLRQNLNQYSLFRQHLATYQQNQKNKALQQLIEKIIDTQNMQEIINLIESLLHLQEPIKLAIFKDLKPAIKDKLQTIFSHETFSLERYKPLKNALLSDTTPLATARSQSTPPFQVIISMQSSRVNSPKT